MSTYGIFRNQITGKKLVFYPCPKNANSSAKLFFAKHLGLDKDYVFIGDKIPRYKQKNYDLMGKKNLVNFLPTKQKFQEIIADYKCCIVRNPIERFLSAYKNRIVYHQDEEFKNHTVNMVLEKLESSNFENKHFLPQNYFLGSDLTYYTFYANTKSILTFQNEVNNFFKNKIIFPKIQTGGHKSDIALTLDQKLKIKKIYKDDFTLLKLKI